MGFRLGSFQSYFSSTCLMVIAGLQSLSSSRMDRHTVPEGYTFGWNNGGSNLPAGTSYGSFNWIFKAKLINQPTNQRVQHTAVV